MKQLRTTLSAREAGERICAKLTLSATLIDRCRWKTEEYSVETMVFEQYFFRNGNRASLTVTITDLPGHTSVRAVGAGGGQGLISSFDWGVGNKLEQAVSAALQGYVQEE